MPQLTSSLPHRIPVTSSAISGGNISAHKKVPDQSGVKSAVLINAADDGFPGTGVPDVPAAEQRCPLRSSSGNNGIVRIRFPQGLRVADTVLQREQ